MFVLTCLSGASAVAQCALQVVPGGDVTYADAAVLAGVAWDPDGNGPAPELLVFGGDFTRFCDVQPVSVVAYDPSTRVCTPLGTADETSGPAPRITAITVAANNDLVVAGRFTSIDNVAVGNIARFDGVSWSAIGAGIPSGAGALAALPNGDLVAGGIAIWPAGQVQVWNGLQWASLGTAVTGAVKELYVLANGDLLAGGGDLLGLGSTGIARWNGGSWSVFAGGIDGVVNDVVTLANGDLAVTGLFAAAGGTAAAHIARWDGSGWSAFGSGLMGYGTAMTQLGSGDVVVAGTFLSAGGVPANRIARWDGTGWQAVGTGIGVQPEPLTGDVLPVSVLQPLANDGLLAAGRYRSLGGGSDNVSRWDGGEWQPIQPGTVGVVHDSVETVGGDLVVVGDLNSVEGVPTNIARRSNGVWQALAGRASGAVFAIVADANGDLVVGGDFTSVDNVAAARVARWDGSSWHALGAGLPGRVEDLAIAPDGRIVAAGTFPERIAVWDGVAWLGTGIVGGVDVTQLVTSPDGDLFAGIASSNFQGICTWTASGWQQISTDRELSGALVRLSNGDFVGLTSGISWRWDGGDWSLFTAALVAYPIGALLALPDGGLLVGRASFPTSNLARASGNQGTPIASVAGQVRHLRWTADGSVFVGGAFTEIDDVGTSGFASLVSTCPATATIAGSGCGGVELAPTSLPWLGGRFRSRASGLPANGIAVEVIGLSPLATPLSSLLPEGVAGCLLLASSDVLRFGASSDPTQLELGIPNAPGLLATTLRQQVVPFAIGGQGAVVAVTASNALQLTIGRF